MSPGVGFALLALVVLFAAIYDKWFKPPTKVGHMIYHRDGSISVDLNLLMRSKKVRAQLKAFSRIPVSDKS